MNSVKVSYELRFRVSGFPWKVFDTYKEKSDPELNKYFNLLMKQEFNGGVKVIKIETIRTEINI